jgi:hypothetical protein
VIAVVLSLVILVAIVSNIVLWNYTLSQADWERSKEDIRILNATSVSNGTEFVFQNVGSVTCHLVSLWVDNSTQHSRFDLNLFIDAGERLSEDLNSVNLSNATLVKVVTARGNIAVYSTNSPST